MAEILVVGNRHLSTANLPRHSRHTFLRLKEFPLGRYPIQKILPGSNDLATWQPTSKKYQVVHCFNQIPYTKKPWIATFEQAFPYHTESWLYSSLVERLTQANCTKLIAISDYARLKFIQQFKDKHVLSKLLDKVEVIHPNFLVKSSHPKIYRDGQVLNIIFIGNQFARKGGIVALRLAKIAAQLKLPIVIHIVSQLNLKAPTDHLDASKYAADLKLLDLPNVIFHQQIPNSKVFDLLRQSHFQLMATLHDTYGYSIVEGFSVATPALTTNVCALPELVHPGRNGYLLNLDLDRSRQWKDWLHDSARQTDEYWDTLNRTFDSLANQALERLLEFLESANKTEIYTQLSAGAIAQMHSTHDSNKANEVFDNLYAKLAGEVSEKSLPQVMSSYR
jgi:glycosyltransferase involved in cell wall biosynthesis